MSMMPARSESSARASAEKGVWPAGLTTITHPATTTHSRLTREDMEAAGISEDMVRVSVGIEDIADIKADFARGLKAAERVAGGA